MRELRDPVHGFVERSDLERRLIDTPVFQRLRRIKQLAMANLVYPGALHTRFDHSIGVMHVAGRVADQVGLTRERRDIVRLAGLLHDVGHGPFSHVSEDVLERYPDESKYKRVKTSKIAEVISWDIINRHPSLSRFLSQQQKEEIVGILNASRGSVVEQQIISGPLDADKQDYVLRDSYFCGVKYGSFDLERLITTLERIDDGSDELLVGSVDGLYGIEQFVVAKYHLTWQVYRHKVRLVTDQMIVRALELGLELDQLPWLRKLYVYDGSEEFVTEYLKWDDARLVNQLLYDEASKMGLCADLFQRLANRSLFKRIFNQELLQAAPDPMVRVFLADLSKERNYKNTTRQEREQWRRCRLGLEAEIAVYLSDASGEKIRAEHVIVNQYGMKSIGEQARNKQLPILIQTASGPRDFEELSLLFGSINKEIDKQFLDVYAPISNDDPHSRKRLYQQISKDLVQIFAEYAKKYLSKVTPTEEHPHANK